ncbi:MAG: hypothetical protein K1X74_10170 [Pirellulales bacterium]|nr:hypothetical protein [Pirellulales bacterium]
MPNLNRNALIARLQKVLRKHYKPWTPTERPTLEQLLFACLLEDAPYGPAEQCFAMLQEQFFDWNEVRVSTVKELAEVLSPLPGPAEAAARLRRALQHVFEATYTFELDSLRKLKLSQSQQKLEKMDGVTRFGVSFLTQVALGGHAIPLDRSTLAALSVVGLADPKEVAAGAVTGLERAIPKSKGVEFASLLHQLGAEYAVNPYAPSLHEILVEINPAAKDNLPKRPTKKQIAEAQAAAKAEQKKAEEAKRLAAAKAIAKKVAAAKAAHEEAAAAKRTPVPEKAPAPATPKAKGDGKKSAAKAKAAPAAKPAAKKPATSAKKSTPKVASKKPR